MALPQGINFRSTAGFVTDAANTYAQTATTMNYPTTTAEGNNVGWQSGSVYVATDDDSGLDARLAGFHRPESWNNTYYRIDLPATGDIEITFGAGHSSILPRIGLAVYDDTTLHTTLISRRVGTVGHYTDAADTDHTSAANWVSSQVKSGTLTMSTTSLRLLMPSGSGHLAINHLMVESVGSGTQDLTPSLYSDGDTFYSGTITPGQVSLSPGLFVDSDTFYSATINPGAVNLTPSLYNDTDSFLSPTVSVGAVNLTPSLFADSDTFYAATVSLSGAPQDLTPSLFVDSDVFHVATVSPGQVDLTPGLLVDGDVFHAATVTLGFNIAPSLFVDADTFYAATVSVGAVDITPSLYSDTDSFYSPTVSLSGAPQNLTPSLFADTDVFHAPTVSSVYGLTPTLFIDSDSFYSSTISTGAANLTPSLFVDSDAFYVAVVDGGTVIATPASRTYVVEARDNIYLVQ